MILRVRFLLQSLICIRADESQGHTMPSALPGVGPAPAPGVPAPLPPPLPSASASSPSPLLKQRKLKLKSNVESN